jgi:hypothetical protein
MRAVPALLVLPLPVVLAVLALLATALVYGFAGPPARRQHPVVTVLLLGLGLLSLPFGVGALVVRHPVVGMSVVSAGVLLFAGAAHFLRAQDGGGGDEPGGGGEGGPRRPTGPDRGPGGLSVDWDAFDRERAGWSADDRPLSGTR